MATATQELLDRLAQWYGGDSIASDYRLAKDYFKVTTQKVSEYRTGKRSFADDRVLAICADMWPGDDEQAAYWLLRMHEDREQNEQIKSVWHRLAKAAQAASLGLVAVVGLALAPLPADAGQLSANTIYYVKYRRFLRRLLKRPAYAGRALVAIFIAPLILFNTGCSTMQREVAWQALHAVDVAQTINGPARDDCFIEADRLTRSLIGENPSTGEVLGWGVGLALVHAGVTYGLDRASAPQWLQIGWQAITITNTSYSLVNNHREGIRPFGENDCPHG